MNYWLISDTHFNHSKLEEWGGRSGPWQEKLFTGISKIEDRNDVLIHLGDISIGSDEEVHRNLMMNVFPGVTKILVRGNHDKKSASWYKEHGWDFVCDQIGLKFHGVDLLLSHRPMPPDTWRYRYNIHGHTHGNIHRAEEYASFYDDKNYHIDISPEVIGYLPVRLDTLMRKYKI
jgi:calcineurin-like phosphoesterase family protein